MATSGTATVTTGLLGEKKVEKAFEMTLSSGALTFNITLDQTFDNDPKMLAIPEAGTDGTYTMTYVSATPKLVCTVASESNLPNSTVDVIVVAYDQP